MYLPTPPHESGELDIPWPLCVDLITRRLNLEGTTTLNALRKATCLSMPIVETIFRHLQQEKLLEIRGMRGHDYVLALTAAGRQSASDRMAVCHYAGPAPVALSSYHRAVRTQAVKIKLNRQRMRNAFTDLVLTDNILDRLGPAMVLHKSLFLYGPTGNGKTSISERLLRVYEDNIVIPYAVEVDGRVITVFDPVIHQPAEHQPEELDPRWVLCHRPSVTVGGELTFPMLELRLDAVSNIYSAPVQMKANNGILVIDDFGRQVIPARDLLNRWILPLDRRVDYLSLSHGLKFQIPFESMVVFATNLTPSTLADEAFLRRIKSKIYIGPVEDNVFDEIFLRVARELGLAADGATAAYVRDLCIQSSDGQLRACYPSDLCELMQSIHSYEERPISLAKEDFQKAADLYFARHDREVEA